jgi:hypothetical protein
MSSEHTPKPRPYWHVDAKWIAGLLLSLTLSVTLLIFGLVQVTAEKPAIDVLTLGMALMYSPNGLDDETEIEEMRQLLEASPDGSIQPIPGLQISVRERDIEGLTPREVRLHFFRMWAEPVYQDGIEGLADLADDPELRSEIIEGGGLFNVLTLKTHQALQRGLVVAVIASLLLFIPLVIFSYRFGRIGSPGCVFFFASLPGVLFFSLIGIAIKPISEPPVAEGSMTGMLGYLVSNLLPSLAKSIAQGYLIFLAVGLGLLLLAGLSNTIWRVTHKQRQ